MTAYVKRRSDFRTVASAEAVSWDVPISSSGDETGTIAVCGNSITRGHEGGFLLMNGHIWLINTVTPDEMYTTISVIDAINVFDRLLVYETNGASIGGFIADGLTANYKSVADTAYAMPYLSIENRDATAFAVPEVVDGLYSMKQYIQAVRRSHNITVELLVSRDTLRVIIDNRVRPVHHVVFNDGHSQLTARSYSRSCVAKVTTLQNGAAIDWYLAADGSISNTEPVFRAQGEWQTVALTGGDAAEKAADIFAQNTGSHKIEWCSDRRLELFDDKKSKVRKSDVPYCKTPMLHPKHPCYNCPVVTVINERTLFCFVPRCIRKSFDRSGAKPIRRKTEEGEILWNAKSGEVKYTSPN